MMYRYKMVFGLILLGFAPIVAQEYIHYKTVPNIGSKSESPPSKVREHPANTEWTGRKYTGIESLLFYRQIELQMGLSIRSKELDSLRHLRRFRDAFKLNGVINEVQYRIHGWLELYRKDGYNKTTVMYYELE